MVVPDSASGAAEPTSDVACFLFDLACAAFEERAALVSVLVAMLQRAGTTTVVNSHEVALMLRRSLGVAPANVFDSQARVPGYVLAVTARPWNPSRMHHSDKRSVSACMAAGR